MNAVHGFFDVRVVATLDQGAVHREGRRALQAELVAGRAILLHAGLVAMVGERLPDAARLDVAARGQLIQQVPRELGLMVEDLIVETPEGLVAALRVGLDGRLGGDARVRMASQRVVAVAHSHRGEVFQQAGGVAPRRGAIGQVSQGSGQAARRSTTGKSMVVPKASLT